MESASFSPGKIIPLYGGGLAIYYILLSARVIRARRKYLVSLGDGTLEYLSFIESERVRSAENIPGKSISKPDPPFSSRSLDVAKYREMQRLTRAHSNFIEYVPFSLVLLYFAESNHFLSPLMLHVSCAALVLARLIHAEIAFASRMAISTWRPIGVTLNFVVLGFAGIVNVYNCFIA